LDEFPETFLVNLSNSVNTSISYGTGIGIIEDDDPLPNLSISDVSVFVKEFGAKVEARDKFTFKKKDLREKGTDCVVLKI